MGAGRSGGGEPGEEGQDGRLRAQMMQQSLPDNVRGRAHLLAHVVREVGRPATVRWQMERRVIDPVVLGACECISLDGTRL